MNRSGVIFNPVPPAYFRAVSRPYKPAHPTVQSVPAGLKRFDSHVHLGTIDPSHANHQTRPPSAAELDAYLQREHITGIAAIVDNLEELSPYQSLGIPIAPILWVRDPMRPNIHSSAVGIKIHPFLERYPLQLDRIRPVLDEANRRGLFVMIHMDDRNAYYKKCRPSHLIPIAKAYPNVRFIIAHAGSYDPPGRVRLRADVQQKLARLSDELVAEAVNVTRQFPNVYLETSIIAYPRKARILRNAPVEKMILGSDFPILNNSRQRLVSLAYQEQHLLQAGFSWTEIQTMYDNARQLMTQTQ